MIARAIAPTTARSMPEAGYGPEPWTMGKSKRGALYRLDPDTGWQSMGTGYVITNGPAFSPDGNTLYHTDTLARTVFAFDLSANGTNMNK